MAKENIIIENANFSLEYKNNKLILFIRDSKSFIFENALYNVCKQWLEEGKPQDELEKFIKKQNDKYFINKPLEVCAENTNKDIAQESKDYDTESRKSTQESSECDKESKRKIIYLQDELSFKNCVFNGEVHFKYIVFVVQDSKESAQPLRIDFQHCEFHKRMYFTNCEFNGNVFFNHAKFYKYADFHESIFNGVVSFYNAEFKSAPNFSTCVFQNLQATNFINVKIDEIDFDKILYFIAEHINDGTYKKEVKSLKDKYLQKLQENKENQCEIDKKYKENKKGIAKEHRIRYASNARDSFRTIKNVLIANNNLLDASIWHKLELYAKEIELKLQKPCLSTTPKKWCDLWQLKLYRKTSAHHTDLLKIWNTLIILNGVFGILFGLVLLLSHCQIDFAKCAYMLELYTNCYIKSLYEIYNNFGKVCINIILSLLFIVLFLCCAMGKISRNLFVFIGYVASSIILITNPKYLFPAVSLFEKSENFSHIATISATYTFFFILVIFSLQKTARKNSIIPS